MTLEKALELAAECLPENWTIHVGVEQGAGWVEAERPDGTRVDMHADWSDLTEQVLAAIGLAHDEDLANQITP